MDIPRGHAMLPLSEADFLDFILNYFKAEYAPIRSFFSTTSAQPRQPERWSSMGHELLPLSFRPANAQAQKDLESLDFFVQQRNLDASFVRGIVIRFAKYEIHERLEKKLYESCRLDLMVRKALKEKHLIDALWPSPAPRSIPQEVLQQGVKVRSWYGDMFAKYFRYLHSVDDFGLRPEVDARIKSSGTLMLVPYVDHLVLGTADPIMPIVAKGAGYSNAQAWKQKNREDSYGEPDKFEIRFDAPTEISDTHTRSVVRQCQCLKCGTKRGVIVVISIDPSPGPTPQNTSSTRMPSNPSPSGRKHRSKAAQRYSPGDIMPGTGNFPAHHPRSPQDPSQDPPSQVAPTSLAQQKQCPRCTFLNHPDLAACEMCASDLPESTLVSKAPGPIQTSKSKQSSHFHSVSLPSNTTPVNKEKDDEEQRTRPAPPNRHSLSSTLFSIFPFSQQHQPEHRPNSPPTQPAEPSSTKPQTSRPRSENQERPISKDQNHFKHKETAKNAPHVSSSHRQNPDPEPLPESGPQLPTKPHSSPHNTHATPSIDLDQPPEMAMMPLTAPPTDSQSKNHPVGMPQNLMDDFVPVSASYRRDEGEDDAGWGEMSREEARKEDSDDEDDGDVVGRREGLVDLDAVAREEMGVWGDD
ncbi:hypothetical protein K469DRAFT_684733 [Zopfia rhizophila CBS 207.26]|uniref:RanBP2-type domain-containing protein n=1 Tax=Zopfia rhizophila CBS 207.26 TaxID=1314779 RepID=A0A6A6EFT8_9PEZI|nr:hypothetical protein K469DRAFT_684733 [Zopfia rhizophila CBS 207.26]